MKGRIGKARIGGTEGWGEIYGGKGKKGGEKG